MSGAFFTFLLLFSSSSDLCRHTFSPQTIVTPDIASSHREVLPILAGYLSGSERAGEDRHLHLYLLVPSYEVSGIDIREPGVSGSPTCPAGRPFCPQCIPVDIRWSSQQDSSYHHPRLCCRRVREYSTPPLNVALKTLEFPLHRRHSVCKFASFGDTFRDRFVVLVASLHAVACRSCFCSFRVFFICFSPCISLALPITEPGQGLLFTLLNNRPSKLNIYEQRRQKNPPDFLKGKRCVKADTTTLRPIRPHHLPSFFHWTGAISLRYTLSRGIQLFDFPSTFTETVPRTT